MFNSSRPPLLVQPITAHHFTLFPTHEGYTIHPIDSNLSLVSYKQGWTIPLSLQMQAFVTEEPLLLVRDKGGVTSGGSTSSKGYAHQFCNGDGSPVKPFLKSALFPDKPKEEWMLVRGSASIVWLQYGSKTQFLGSSGHQTTRNDYGKLLIRDFTIREAFAPRLDRASDIASAGEKQYRVESHKAFADNWSLTDGDTAAYLEKKLSEHQLDHYWPAVNIALKRAMHEDRV